MSESRPRAALHVLLTALSALAAACASPAQSPTGPSPVLSRGATPQTGAPAPDGSLGTVNALGATSFMAFGDSITCGVVSSFDASLLYVPSNCSEPTFSYPRQLRNLLATSFPSQTFAVANEGSPGEEAVFAISTNRFRNAMAANRPQAVLLLEGINDLNNDTSITSVVNALQQMVEIARVYSATVFVGTMYQTCYSVDPNTGRVRTNSTDRIVPFNTAVRTMAAGRQNVYVVDLYAAFGTGNCGPDRGINLLGGDGLHPSVNGFTVMASTFGVAMRDRLAVRGSYQ